MHPRSSNLIPRASIYSPDPKICEKGIADWGGKQKKNKEDKKQENSEK